MAGWFSGGAGPIRPLFETSPSCSRDGCRGSPRAGVRRRPPRPRPWGRCIARPLGAQARRRRAAALGV